MMRQRIRTQGPVFLGVVISNLKYQRPWLVLFLAAAIALTGCTVTPTGENALRRQAATAGKPYEKPYAQRHIPPLPVNATAGQLIRFAVLNSPVVERAYWQWRAAIEQIPQAGTQATTLMLNAGTTIQNGQASLANTILGAGNMTSSDIRWPGKLTTQARAALDAARAAGWQYRSAIFTLRRNVLAAWYQYARTSVVLRLAKRQEQLVASVAALTKSGISTGGRQPRQWLTTRNAIDELQARIVALQNQLPRRLAALNALLGRSAGARLNPPQESPVARTWPIGDSRLWALAMRRNPELRRLRFVTSANRMDIDRARQQYIPNFDLNLSSSLDGTAQSFSSALVIPVLRYQAINASIAQAGDQLRATQAALRNQRITLAARLLIDLIAMRNDRRQLHIFKARLLPRVRIIAALADADYQQGTGTVQSQLNAQEMILEIQETIADLKTDRGIRIADVDAIIAAPL
jgi:outer membrane protein TolC